MPVPPPPSDTGSPGTLLTSVGTGVMDFFFEPVKGMTKSPDAVLRGVLKGTGSLVQNTVHGTCSSVSRPAGLGPHPLVRFLIPTAVGRGPATG